MLEQYFKDILKVFQAGDSTEASFYGALKNFIDNFATAKHTALQITAQPKRTISGIPDFVIRRGKELIGYIEAKDIGKELEHIAYSEQIEKYKADFDNFILTNYFDFWLWRKKEKRWVLKVCLHRSPIINLKAGLAPTTDNKEPFFDLLAAFLNFNIPERKTAKLLAKDLAGKARLIPNFIVEELNDNVVTEIVRIYESFKKFLIADLSKEDFADIYSQTITYGLFMARLQHQGAGFNRFLAQQYLPKTITVLRETFALVSGQNLPDSLNWVVDDIATILAYCDIENIKKELHAKTGGDDPLMHFYETFLKEYNPKEKKHRGVYYTPLPVVSYIARSVNILLKEKFDKSLGFADASVTILDPASGTLTFPAKAIEIAKKEIDQSAQAGSWLNVAKEHILKDFYAFELLMAPYIIGHLKVFLLLENLGYKMQSNDRFPLFLTNTLDLSEVEQSALPFVAGLSEEASRAQEVKEKVPILVIMGNPPYSAISRNKGDWILEKINDYRQIEGESLKERKDWLMDDYVKFFRFAQWKIEQAGQGILGFITNHAWLDNPTFRGMRYSLMKTFDEIYILNLHGNYKKKEKTPQGGKDENVFDIQQGVSIVLMMKSKASDKQAKIKYLDFWGLREEKYDFLETHDVKNTKWQNIKPKVPYWFLIARDEAGEEDYQKYLSISDIFSVFSTGIVTARDGFVIDQNRGALESRIERFRNSIEDDEAIKAGLRLNENYAWRVSSARKDLKAVNDWRSYFQKILYRPFDERWIYFHPSVVWRVRGEVMENMLKPNLAITICRQNSGKFSHIFIGNALIESCYVSNKTKEIGYVLPLYLYNQNFYGPKKLKKKFPAGTMMLFDKPNIPEKQSNIKLEVIQKLSETYKKKISPEDIFYYIYGVLHSNVFRQKYNEFLKIDFPKIPFTNDVKLFFKIGELGNDLADLHLFKSPKLAKLLASFPVSTGNVLTNGLVEKIEYNLKQKRLYINNQQYFADVEPEVWDYYIGGYQILNKWLKDKKDHNLSSTEVDHYLKVITVLQNTIKLQKDIDKLYPAIETSLMLFHKRI